MRADRQTAVPRKSVRDVMQVNLVSVVPEMTIRELILTLLESAVTGAPVLDARGKIVGVVSTTDVLRLIARDAEIPSGQASWVRRVMDDELDEGLSAFTAPDADALTATVLDECQVRDIMTPVAFTVKPTDDLGSVASFLLRGRIHRALVVENGALLGIVTPFDLLEPAKLE